MGLRFCCFVVCTASELISFCSVLSDRPASTDFGRAVVYRRLSPGLAMQTARFRGDSIFSLVEFEHESVQWSLERLFLEGAQLALGLTTVAYVVFISITAPSGPSRPARRLPKQQRTALFVLALLSLVATTWHFVDNL